MMDLKDKYRRVRMRSEEICATLKTEDYVVQPVAEVSPPKWHLGHTSWFFETFILVNYLPGYSCFNPSYPFVFNSYYESFGARVIRTNRGNLSRPDVEEVYQYRRHIDAAMEQLLSLPVSDELTMLVVLGLNHEEQHQELLATDIKFILGHNPLFPTYKEIGDSVKIDAPADEFIVIKEALYEIGYSGNEFCFDNELGRHTVLLPAFGIAKGLVTNAQYLEFIEDGGYRKHEYWHAEGLDWIKNNNIMAPLYWHWINNQWHYYSAFGIQPLQPDEPVTHVSYYEASAFAAWKGMRLPTEFEWEAACGQFTWGKRWEWTASAYLPYPRFARSAGPIGEYNGKFMVNQMVLRGASVVTPPGHSRPSYRNFFHPHLRWQYTGIRLAQYINDDDQSGKILFTFKKKKMQDNLRELSIHMNEMVTNGQLIYAAEKYYASNIRTIEFDGRVTEGKQAAMKKLNDFVGSIQKVNKIDLLRTVTDDNVSFSEYILDFDMKDGSNLYLHEIVRSLWENGQVVEERYFKG